MPLNKQWKFTPSLPRRILSVTDLGSQIHRAVLQLIDASLPNRCLMCHQGIELGSGICPSCLNAVLYQTPSCLGCGRSLVVQTAYCGACMKQQPLKVVAPASYHHGIGEQVAAIKYQAQLAGLEAMTAALVRRVLALEQLHLIQRPQALVIVPLHPNRLRQRGFNQAWLIAESLSRQLDIPLIEDALVRIVDTRPQEGLTGKQRRRNLADAFRLKADFGYQRVAIVDDVVTTGTTAQTIAKLFEVDYIQVQVWCLARAEAPGLLEP
ncbi:ComF family protein [Shewanella sp. Isolate11]|uniref:ComF family protein n=1 Tax=Shewanella sp. Isolate11 TaxID=2908530 RepID=UPI001EFE6C5B|nr:ComF family protein [Shewanella sp. Isolate11]MCG9697917.1 ComF family protein [Shewanella sp. Isolate11]